MTVARPPGIAPVSALLAARNRNGLHMKLYRYESNLSREIRWKAPTPVS